MERTHVELDKLSQRVMEGKLKAPEKIGAAAARILSRHHGQRYYSWAIKEGKIHKKLHWIPANLLAGGKWFAVRRSWDICLNSGIDDIKTAW